jgi:hypothetical protein
MAAEKRSAGALDCPLSDPVPANGNETTKNIQGRRQHNDVFPQRTRGSILEVPVWTLIGGISEQQDCNHHRG